MARPAAGGEEGVEDAQVARQAVAVRRVEHQHAVRAAQAAVAVEQVSLGVREEGLAGGDGMRVTRGHSGLGVKVERVAEVLEPPESVLT
ncbi:hypothetical protein BKK81_19550 [Cupriavidus sp. USMAHM13]|nr:hypothetical protein BKK81_19550 [Cupriavidus sp. USMAHM13]